MEKGGLGWLPFDCCVFITYTREIKRHIFEGAFMAGLALSPLSVHHTSCNTCVLRSRPCSMLNFLDPGLELECDKEYCDGTAVKVELYSPEHSGEFGPFGKLCYSVAARGADSWSANNSLLTGVVMPKSDHPYLRKSIWRHQSLIHTTV